MSPSSRRLSLSPALQLALALALLLMLRATSALTIPIAITALAVLVLSDPAERLQRRGVPAVFAAALVVFVPTLALAVFAWLAAPALVGWLSQARRAFDRLLGALQPPPGDSGPMADAVRWLLARRWNGAGDEAAWLQQLGAPLLAGAAVAMLSFFLLWAQRSLVAGLLAAQPDRRARIRLVGGLRDARRGAGHYLATMGWINLALAGATALGLLALGVDHVPAWIAIVFVLLFVPYLGPAAAALLLLTATPPGGSAWSIAAPALLFLGLHAIEAQFISPWWMGRRLRVGRPALLLAVMAGGWAWGVVGGVLAVPLLIAAQALVNRRRGSAAWRAWLAGESDDAPSLVGAVTRVLENRATIRAVAVRPEPGATTPDPAPCDSPTSPKPIRPRSTASR